MKKSAETINAEFVTVFDKTKKQAEQKVNRVKITNKEKGSKYSSKHKGISSKHKKLE